MELPPYIHGTHTETHYTPDTARAFLSLSLSLSFLSFLCLSTHLSTLSHIHIFCFSSSHTCPSFSFSACCCWLVWSFSYFFLLSLSLSLLSFLSLQTSLISLALFYLCLPLPHLLSLSTYFHALWDFCTPPLPAHLTHTHHHTCFLCCTPPTSYTPGISSSSPLWFLFPILTKGTGASPSALWETFSPLYPCGGGQGEGEMGDGRGRKGGIREGAHSLPHLLPLLSLFRHSPPLTTHIPLLTYIPISSHLFGCDGNTFPFWRSGPGQAWWSVPSATQRKRIIIIHSRSILHGQLVSFGCQLALHCACMRLCSSLPALWAGMQEYTHTVPAFGRQGAETAHRHTGSACHHAFLLYSHLCL